MTVTKPAIAVEKSNNTKTGPVSATYVSQGSCPTTCPLLGAGCYAESGHTGIATRQLRQADKQMTPLQLARAEAREIDTLSGSRPLRLHVVGDARTNGAAKTLAAAAQRYMDKLGMPVWTYTHAWRKVDRASWGNISVRASTENVTDLWEIEALGYAAALIVDHHPADGRAWAAPDGTKVIPCPEQTRGTTCSDCRLCWTTDHAIAFAAHGARAEMVKETIR